MAKKIAAEKMASFSLSVSAFGRDLEFGIF